MTERVSKISIVKAHYDARQYAKALAIAARFPQLGKEEQAIRMGHEAYAHPDFYRQLRKDVEQLQRDGVAALASKYGWEQH